MDTESALHNVSYIKDKIIAGAVREKATHVWSIEDDEHGMRIDVYTDPDTKRVYAVDNWHHPHHSHDRVVIFRSHEIDWLDRWMKECSVEDPYALPRTSEPSIDAQSDVVTALPQARRRSRLGLDILEIWYGDE